MLAASWSGIPAAVASNITGVQVSPDAKQIMIKGDGPLGKHSAFVINQPHRLVVDFDAAGLAPIPARIKVNRDSINEIRLGRVNSRSRVVADFGDYPVPPFKIHLQGHLVVIALSDGPAPPARVAKPSPPSSAAVNAPHKPTAAARPANASAVSGKGAGMLIRSSGIKDGQVFVELADRRDPKRLYRLAIDCDLASHRIRQATLSDSSGAVRRFEVADVNATSDGPQEKGQLAVGPRKEGMSQAAAGTRSTKYQWGLPNVENKEPQGQEISLKSPFRFDDSETLPRVSAR
jgi:hypothetical protein